MERAVNHEAASFTKDGGKVSPPSGFGRPIHLKYMYGVYRRKLETRLV